MKKFAWVASGLLALSSVLATPAAFAQTETSNTTTPIKHVVVIFSENISFDHYFGTYPNAANLPGETQFVAKPNTPYVNGLLKNVLNGNLDLLTQNPNAAQPKRLAPSQAMTADMDHEYKAEQEAVNGGKMDKFVESTSGGSDKTLVMNYYDGNTVTGLWNYAQNFAMSDNSFGTVYGPSTPGALNLISGQTHGATGYKGGQAVGDIVGNVANSTVIGDPDPYFDKASNPKRAQTAMSGKNVGNLLNDKGVTWGWFQGGFRDTSATHTNIGGGSSTDYNPHHQPFQYYESTSNKDHLAPSSVQAIGHQGDQANHQYDLTDFWDAVNAHNMPAVSYLKAANYQDGHAGYSDPLDEQTFITNTINHLENTPEWKDTAVIISYDDSDGWYDHVYHAPVNGSNDPNNDALFGNGNAGTPSLGNYLDRAGYGPRLPLLVVSPYAKQNYVDHTLTDQTSILKFIEDNWNLGRIGDNSFDSIAGSINNMFDFSKPSASKLYLNTKTGQPLPSSSSSLFQYLTSFLVSKDGGVFGPINDGTSIATVTVPANAFSNDIQVNITHASASSLGNLIPNDKTFAAAFGVNFSSDVTPAGPIKLTITDPSIHANSEVFKVQGGNLVKVDATVSEGQADLSFTTDPDFVVLNPKVASTESAQSAQSTQSTPVVPKSTGQVVVGGTSPVTGISFVTTALGALACLVIGYSLVRSSLRKSK